MLFDLCRIVTSILQEDLLETSAPFRLKFHWFRGAQNPAEDDASAQYWLKRQREHFHAGCQEHLDDVLAEIRQMTWDALQYAKRTEQEEVEDDKAAFRATLLGRFPHAPRTEDVSMETLLQEAEKVRMMDLDGLVLDKFEGWRDLPPEKLEALALEWMSLLLEQHDHLVGRFCRTYNLMGDQAGWGFYGLRDWLGDFRNYFWSLPSREAEEG